VTSDKKTGNARRATHLVTRHLSLVTRLRRIKLFLCDVDGVMTDGAVFIGGAREIKRFDIRDGFGLVLLRRAGLKVGWVSSRPSPVTRLRARELKIDFLVQQEVSRSKVAAVEKLLRRTRRHWDEVCYVGDDIMDLGVLRQAGVAVAVGNGIREVKAAAHYVTGAPGGHGAIREVVEMILKAQGKWNSIVAHYQK
jgi:3-deoxy-D-manno-octulosonate 8-phosphate phosphatase (KDO 8-P phosphatase)